MSKNQGSVNTRRVSCDIITFVYLRHLSWYLSINGKITFVYLRHLSSYLSFNGERTFAYLRLSNSPILFTVFITLV